MPKPEGAIECTVCTLIVQFAEQELTQNSTVSEIEKFLEDKVCGLLPSFLKDPCDSLVEQYGPQLAQDIQKDQPPSKVCGEVHLCNTSNNTAVVKPELMVKLQKPFPESVECNLCDLIINYAENFLDSNATIADIENFVNHTLCSLLPSFLKDPCQNLVDEYLPEIVDGLDKKYPASKICADIGLCQNSTAAVNPAVVKPELMMKLQKPFPESVECNLCDLIINYAENFLDSNATIADIENFVNHTLCSLLPSFLKDPCQNLVDEYLPEIVDGLDKKYPASKICADIGLCQNSTLVVKPELMVKLQKPAPATSVGCNLCQLIINYAESELDSNSTIQEIEQFLNNSLCNLLPSFLKDPCDELVDEYLPGEFCWVCV